ncbi:MAG: Flp pilus assembly protein CpaB [Phycisphaerae bacterium]
MMNGKAVIPLVAGLCVGGFALKMVFDTVKKAKGAQTPMATLLAARHDIPVGTAIDETMIQSIQFPVKSVPEGAFTKKEELIGRVPRMNAAGGLPILASMLHPEGTPAGLVVKSGLRAVAVRIDESSGVDNHLWPGCSVDVVGYFNIRKNGKQETVARTIIENVQVAAVGQRLSTVSVDDTDGKKKERPARAVTLFVKPEQVPMLHLAEQRGKIKLSMRSNDDGTNGDDAEKHDYAANDSLITGEEDEEPKGQAPNQLAGLFGRFLGQDKQDSQPPQISQPQVLPQPMPQPEAPKPAHITLVFNGDSMEEYQWKSLHSRERVLPPGAQNPHQKSSQLPIQMKSNSNDVIADEPEPEQFSEPVDGFENGTVPQELPG